MGHWEASGETNEWYTPKYIFDALGCEFDLDVASPPNETHVPCRGKLTSGALEKDWHGFVWMNPPFGGRNQLRPWLQKFCGHQNGVALVPDRTSAPWFLEVARKVDSILFVSPKVKFERPDGTLGGSPSTGTALLAMGAPARAAVARAEVELGLLVIPQNPGPWGQPNE